MFDRGSSQRDALLFAEIGEWVSDKSHNQNSEDKILPRITSASDNFIDGPPRQNIKQEDMVGLFKDVEEDITFRQAKLKIPTKKHKKIKIIRKPSINEDFDLLKDPLFFLADNILDADEFE